MMGSKQQIGILKRDGLGKQHFDMENILTRSLYRVLNNTSQVPSHLSSKDQNVDKMGYPSDRKTTIAVARPNNHKIGNANTVDLDMQMRLLAQEICGKVERKYERKLDETRERDRRETERRLASIRSEYEAKYQLQVGNLEKEKMRMADGFAERERTMEHRMEMRAAEKEHDLLARQRMLENRVVELAMNKENFEKSREEWQRKMAAEVEELKMERDRIELATARNSEKRRGEIAVELEVKMWKKRTEELEEDANETRKKIGEMMEENFRLKDQIGSVDQVRRELDVTTVSLNDTREELAASRVEIRRTGDYDQIREENEQLRMEIERIRLQNQQRIQKAVEETVAEYSAKEAKWKRIAGLSQQRIAVLTEKLKDAEMAKEVLQQELKTVQKMVGRSGSSGFSKLSKKRSIREVSPSDSTSSLSEGEMEILNIRQRIQNLDEIAKELDASVEHFSMHGATKQKALELDDAKGVELYDDFCRALHNAVLDDEGSPVQKMSTPQKSRERKDSEEGNKEEKEWLKKNIRVISPPAARKIVEPKADSPKQELKETRVVEVKSSPVQLEIPEMSELEKRMQARASEKNQMDRRSRMLQLVADEEEKKPEPELEPSKTAPEAPASTSADNPLFAGVNPAMAEYMQKVLASRNQSTPSQTIQSVPTTTAPPISREVEVTLADELDLEMDQPGAAGDDDWW